jgi:hypothetical protein
MPYFIKLKKLKLKYYYDTFFVLSEGDVKLLKGKNSAINISKLKKYNSD